MAALSFSRGEWTQGAFAVEIALAFLYAIAVFIGPKAALADATAGVRAKFVRTTRRSVHSRAGRAAGLCGHRQPAPTPAQPWPGALEPPTTLGSRSVLDGVAHLGFQTPDLAFSLDVADAAFGGTDRDRLLNLDSGPALVGGSSRSRELIATIPRGSLRTEPIGD